MTDELVIRPDDLVFDDNLDPEQWSRIGEQLSAADREIQWMAGDWASFGIATYRDGRIRCEEILSHYSSDRIAKLVWVTERFAPHRRRTDLSFSHHEAVASLPDAQADRILAGAVENRLSVRDVAAQARFVQNQIRSALSQGAEEIQAAEEDRPDQIQELTDLFAQSYEHRTGYRIDQAAAKDAVAAVLTRIGWKPT